MSEYLSTKKIMLITDLDLIGAQERLNLKALKDYNI